MTCDRDPHDLLHGGETHGCGATFRVTHWECTSRDGYYTWGVSVKDWQGAMRPGKSPETGGWDTSEAVAEKDEGVGAGPRWSINFLKVKSDIRLCGKCATGDCQ